MDTEWITLDLLDELDMEEAQKKLQHAQEYGLDREVWHVYFTDSSNFPNYDRGFFDWLLMQKKEFKSSSESAQNYISRLVKSGKTIEYNGNIYVVKGSLGLDFRLSDEGVQETHEAVNFYNVDEDSFFCGIIVDLEDVEGIVPIRNHNFRLDYQGWDTAKNLQRSEGQVRKQPDTIMYY